MMGTIQTSADGKPVPFFRLSAYYFCYYAFLGIFMPYIALYLQWRGFPAVQIGMLMSIMQVMRTLAPNAWGWLADRTGRRMLVMRVAALFSMLGFLGMGTDAGIWGIAASIAVMAFFWTAQSPLAETTVFSHLQGRPGYGIVRAWGSFGFIVSVLGMGWLLQYVPIRSVYVAGVAALVIVLVSSLVVPEAPKSTGKHSRKGLWEIVRQPAVYRLFAACMLMTSAHGAFNVFYSIHLVAAGYGKGQVGMLWTLGVLSEILVFIIAPRLMARFSLLNLQLFALACAGVRFLLIGWCVDWLPVVLLGQCMHGITFGVNHIAAISAVSRLFKEPHQAQGQALYGSISFGAGGIIGSVSSGWLWDGAGPGWAFTCCAGFAALGFLVMWTRRGQDLAQA